MRPSTSTHWFLVIGLIILAAAARFAVPGDWFNFSPIGAMALFGAATIRRSWLAIALPVSALFLSDLILNNTALSAWYDGGFTLLASYQAFTVGSMVLTVVLGRLIFARRITAIGVVGGSLGAAVLFFLVTNAGAWWMSPQYTKDVAGLLASYAAGVPFFRNTLVSQLLFGGVLFGLHAWMKRRVPSLRPAD